MSAVIELVKSVAPTLIGFAIAIWMAVSFSADRRRPRTRVDEEGRDR